MKSQPFAANSGQTTKSIAGTWIDGGRVCEGGTNRKSDGIEQMCRLSTLLDALVNKTTTAHLPVARTNVGSGPVVGNSSLRIVNGRVARNTPRATSLLSFATRFYRMGRVRPDAAEKHAITKELQASLRNSIRSVPEGAWPPWNANLTCS